MSHPDSQGPVLFSGFAWSLIQFLWQGAFLAGALATALRILRNRSADLRYRIGCIVLAGMTLCPLLSVATFMNAAPPTRSSAKLVSTPTTVTASAAPANSRWTKAEAATVAWIDSHSRDLLLLWSLGALAGLAQVVIAVAAARQLRRAAVEPAQPSLQFLADRIGRELRISHSVPLLLSSRVGSPVVAGFRRHTILLPSGSFHRLSPQQAQAILAHELAHIRRRDSLVNMLQSLAEALLFYNPAVRWVSRRIRRDREYCCDDLALRMSDSPLAYAKALAVLEERRHRGDPEFSIGASGGNLSMRIKRIFAANRPAPLNAETRISLAVLGALTVAILLFVSLAANTQLRAQTTPVPQKPEPASQTAKSPPPPDMSCTFYDAGNGAHPGTCEASERQASTSYCKQTDGKHLRQLQSGCEWKVKRLQRWEKERGSR